MIAIIGVLVGLLLPAVQAAREAGRRSACQSRVRQLALGAINYHDAKRVFPPGVFYREASLPDGIDASSYCSARLATIAPSYVMSANKHGFSWSTLVLPFVEEATVFDRIGAASLGSAQFMADATRLAAVNNRRYASFSCPSDSCPPKNTDMWFSGNGYVGVNANRNDNMPTTNYVASHASHSFWPSVSASTPTTVVDCNGDAFNGIFGVQSSVDMRKVTDGTSKTILLGERSADATVGQISNGPSFGQGKAAGGILFIGMGTRGSYGWPRYVMGYGGINLFNPGPNTDISGFRGLTIASSYSSMHPGGAFFAMCDGAVVFLSENIEYLNSDNGALTTPPSGSVNSVLEALESRNDGRAVAW